MIQHAPCLGDIVPFALFRCSRTCGHAANAMQTHVVKWLAAYYALHFEGIRSSRNCRRMSQRRQNDRIVKVPKRELCSFCMAFCAHFDDDYERCEYTIETIPLGGGTHIDTSTVFCGHVALSAPPSFTAAADAATNDLFVIR